MNPNYRNRVFRIHEPAQPGSVCPDISSDILPKSFSKKLTVVLVCEISSLSSLSPSIGFENLLIYKEPGGEGITHVALHWAIQTLKSSPEDT